MSEEKQCKYDGCDQPAKIRGYCSRHYHYLRRKGLLKVKRRQKEEKNPEKEEYGIIGWGDYPDQII